MTTERTALHGKRALILTADQFEDMELFFPLFRLMEEGVEVTVAAPSKGPIEGERGYGLEVETTIAEINPDDYDILIIPGGSPDGAPRTVRNVEAARVIARDFFANRSRRSAMGRTCWSRQDW